MDVSLPLYYLTLGGSVSPYNAAIVIVERAQILAFECNDVIGQLEERIKTLKSSATELVLRKEGTFSHQCLHVYLNHFIPRLIRLNPFLHLHTSLFLSCSD